MGSFANSLHVKFNDAKAVVASIESAFREAGYETTEEQPDEAAMWGMASSLRALEVSEPFNGWVGVLDSDLVDSAALAADLSQRLKTYAIGFMVNDSDSWHYQLFHKGEQVDEFDSSGGAAGDDGLGGMSPETAQMMASGGYANLQRELENRMQTMQEQLEADMPADIREIQARVQAGTHTPADMKRYGEWGQVQSKRFMGQINDVMAQVLPSLGKIAAPELDLRAHLEKLRPILPPEATDSRVVELLGKQAVFAEEILTEFMQLVGVAPFFANLCYRYLEECTEADLQAAEIKIHAHLKFKNGELTA